MRCAIPFLLTVLGCGLAQAQTPPAPAQALPLEQAAPGRNIEQRIERIRLEDDGTVIEEVRYGGQAQSITVSPKGTMPGYEIVPSSGARSSAQGRDPLPASPGQRVWNVLKF